MASDTTDTRDRLAEALHDNACEYTGDWDLCRHPHRNEADRLIAAGFGDVTALTAEVARLREAAHRLVNVVEHVRECGLLDPDDLLWLEKEAVAALAGTTPADDQERGA